MRRRKRQPLSQIDPRVQDLIGRFGRLDLARPQHDKAAIQRAISKFLADCGLDDMPCVWAEDPLAAYRHVAAIAERETIAALQFFDLDSLQHRATDRCRETAGLQTHAIYPAVRDDFGMITWLFACLALVLAGVPMLSGTFPDAASVVFSIACLVVPVGIYALGKIVKPAWLIEEPRRLTLEMIRAETNWERRGAMVEIYGLAQFLRDVGASLVHEDEFGRLWTARSAGNTCLIVAEFVLRSLKRPIIGTLYVTSPEGDLGWSSRDMRDRVSFQKYDEWLKAHIQLSTSGTVA